MKSSSISASEVPIATPPSSKKFEVLGSAESKINVLVMIKERLDDHEEL
jgi:hypothetical protein